MFPRIASVLLLALLATSSFGAEKPFVRVRWKGNSFHITYKTVVMSYDLQAPGTGSGYNELFMAQINKISTDYLQEKNGIVYMILNIEGNSRGEGAATGQCGAGEEKGKGLFVFHEKGELKSPVFVVYASCFNTIESDVSNDETPSKIPAGKLLTQFEYFRSAQVQQATQLVTVNIYFDEEHPESGITPVETCVMFEPWIKSNQRVRCPAESIK
jgi:hypothetical protein